MKIAWKNLFLEFKGRCSRGEFWIGIAILFAINFVAGLLGPLSLVVSVVSLWPQTAIFVKRLHDMNKSGWLVLVPYLAIFGGITGAIIAGGSTFLTAYQAGDQASMASIMAGAAWIGALLLLSLVISIGFLLWVGLSRPDPDENRYGPPTDAGYVR